MIATSFVKRFFPVALITAMSFALISPVHAQQDGDIPIDVIVGSAPNAGLSWTAAETSAFQNVPYSFEAQTVTGAMAVTVTDTRGTQEGWTATIQGTDFLGTETLDTIPIANLSLAAGPVQVISGDTTPLPTATSIGMTTSPQTVFAAAENSGSGRYSVSYTATLLIPGNTQVDTYATLLHVNLTSAP